MHNSAAGERYFTSKIVIRLLTSLCKFSLAQDEVDWYELPHVVDAADFRVYIGKNLQPLTDSKCLKEENNYV